MTNPFSYFDTIYCLNLERQPERWQEVSVRFSTLGIVPLVERFPAISTPENHHHGCARSWRAMIARSAGLGVEHFLGFEDDVIFLDDTLDVVTRAVRELDQLSWDLCYFGACVHDREFPFVTGSTVLQECGSVTCTHALAIHRRAFAQILSEIPDEQSSFGRWIEEYVAIDQYLAQRIVDGTFRAVISSPRVATQPALRAFADADLALADRYVI
jgi:hypothetical protein